MKIKTDDGWRGCATCEEGKTNSLGSCPPECCEKEHQKWMDELEAEYIREERLGIQNDTLRGDLSGGQE